VRSRTRTAAYLAVVALTAAACGGSDEEPTTDPAETETETADEAADEAADDGADEEPAEDEEAAATEDAEGPLTVYSGRSEELVGEVLAGFTEETGIELDVRYGDTAELAATIINEGDGSPADVYFGQDAGALGALQAEGVLAELPQEQLDQVEPAFASTEGSWVGVTGRVRVVAYSTERVDEDEIPDSVLDLTDESWSGRVGWAPTNGSFQAFVTALRVTEGEDVARQWLEDMQANDAQVFENNSSQLEAIDRGEIDLALVNHYYLGRFTAEDPDFPVANEYLPGDIGGLVNVAGVGILETTDQPQAAEQLVDYLLSADVQAFFAETEEAEFPAVAGAPGPEGLPSVEELDPPAIDLSDLEDLQGTIALLEETGALQ
jgi:iron(III) transport system substrate-binding protein